MNKKLVFTYLAAAAALLCSSAQADTGKPVADSRRGL
jgi:hypothetical protein